MIHQTMSTACNIQIRHTGYLRSDMYQVIAKINLKKWARNKMLFNLLCVSTYVVSSLVYPAELWHCKIEKRNTANVFRNLINDDFSKNNHINIALWTIMWKIQSSLFEPVFSIYCLATLDIGAGIEQPFNCLIIQNSDFQLVFHRKLVFRERSSGVPQEIW